MKTIIHGASLIAVRPRAEELFLLQRQTDFTMRRYTIASIECARGENVFSRRSELSVDRVGEVFVDQGGRGNGARNVWERFLIFKVGVVRCLGFK